VIALRNRSPMNPIASTVCVLVVAGCESGPATPRPLPDVDGTWSVLRTSVSGEGCIALPDLSPVPMVFRTTGNQLELEFIPAPSATALIFRGSLRVDGEFELHWSEDLPEFANTRSTLEGRFVGDAFTANETTESDFFDPGLIDLFDTDHCVTVSQWEGERVQP
jgi:hypothetical protein